MEFHNLEGVLVEFQLDCHHDGRSRCFNRVFPVMARKLD